MVFTNGETLTYDGNRGDNISGSIYGLSDKIITSACWDTNYGPQKLQGSASLNYCGGFETIGSIAITNSCTKVLLSGGEIKGFYMNEFGDFFGFLYQENQADSTASIDLLSASS